MTKRGEWPGQRDVAPCAVPSDPGPWCGARHAAPAPWSRHAERGRTMRDSCNGGFPVAWPQLASGAAHSAESRLSHLIPVCPGESRLSHSIPLCPGESRLSHRIPPCPGESHLSHPIPPCPGESQLVPRIPVYPGLSRKKAIGRLVSLGRGRRRTRRSQGRRGPFGLLPRRAAEAPVPWRGYAWGSTSSGEWVRATQPKSRAVASGSGWIAR